LELDRAAIEHIRALKETDFELAYLAMLTREGLKPLSRWEKPLGERDLDALQQMGLQTRLLRRTVKTGKSLIEAIFGPAPACLDIYVDRFADSAAVRTERPARGNAEDPLSLGLQRLPDHPPAASGVRQDPPARRSLLTSPRQRTPGRTPATGASRQRTCPRPPRPPSKRAFRPKNRAEPPNRRKTS